jgi:hypothetical protein
VMDDFFYGEPQAVPEPSTIAMFLLAGLASVGLRLRKGRARLSSGRRLPLD